MSMARQTGAIVKNVTGVVGGSQTEYVKLGYNFKVTSMEIDFYLNGIKQLDITATNELITIQLKIGSTLLQDNPQEMWSFNNYGKSDTFKPWIIPAQTQVDITIAHTNAATPAYTGDALTFRVNFNGYEIDSNDEELKKLL